jgi:hypothetical protein
MNAGQFIESDSSVPVERKAQYPPTSFRTKVYPPNFHALLCNNRSGEGFHSPHYIFNLSSHSGKKKWANRPLFSLPL